MRDKRLPLRLLTAGLTAGFLVALGGRSLAEPNLALPLPKGVTSVAEGRYASPLSYSDTISWLQRRWSSKRKLVIFRTIVDLPGMLAAHAKGPILGTEWWGANVSRTDGRVQIFLIR